MPEFIRDLERGVPKRVYQAAERPALSAASSLTSILPNSNATARCRFNIAWLPFSMRVCDIIEIYGRVPRTKSKSRWYRVGRALRVGRGTVFIVDDNFIGNKRNVKRLIPVLADWSERHGFVFFYYRSQRESRRGR